MKVCNPFLVLYTLCTGILAQNVPSQSYQLIKSKNLVQYKNHHQLALFQQVPEVRKMLKGDSVTKKVFDLKKAKANEALKNYKTDGKITKNITLDSLGACQGITYQNERYFLYGDREVGVMREYKLTNDSLIYQHKEYRFTVKGENTIKHPTGIAYHKGLPTFVGNSVKQNAAGTLWKAVINCIRWDSFLKTRTLDGNLLKTIDDDTCIQGTRPEYVKYKGKWYVATADYGNKANEVRLYDPQALAKANKTSEKGVLVKKFTCSPWVQNLHWIADKGILVLIQNQIEGRKWRLTFLDLEKSVAAGHEIVLSIIDTDKPDELEGFTLTDKSEKGIAVSSSRKNNVSLMDFGWNKP